MKLVLALAFSAGLLAALYPRSADPEVVRLQRHFDTVLGELRARDVSTLTPAQRVARQTHIERLAAYAARGVFPRNTDFANRRVPYFIDRVGTRCAMAYLIEQSGSGDYVALVSRKINNAYISDIERDPELGNALDAWLRANGLTVAEAARIQPEYGGGGCCTIDPPDTTPPAVTTSYKVGTGAAVAGGVTTVLFNLTRADLGLPRRTTGWLGVGVGALGLALGMTALTKGDEYSTLGILNGGVGAVALVAGLQSILTHDAPPGTVATAPAQRLTVTPYGASGRRAGVMLHLTF